MNHFLYLINISIQAHNFLLTILLEIFLTLRISEDPIQLIDYLVYVSIALSPKEDLKLYCNALYLFENLGLKCGNN